MSASSHVRGRPVRRLGGLLAVCLLAVLLSGCARFLTPPTGLQLNVIGAARVSTVICLDGFGNVADPNYDPLSSCAKGTSSSPNGQSTGQLLVGYLIPDGATAPATLTSPDFTGTNGKVALHQSAEYTKRIPPKALAGTHWVGYVSDEIDLTDPVSGQPVPLTVHLDAAFGLPPALASQPFTGPFVTQEIVGDRATGPGSPGTASRPLNCSEHFGSPQTPSSTDCQEDTASVTVPTRDLAVQTGASAPAGAAGTTVAVPFKLAFRGAAAPFATFALSASTDLAGASATPADPELTPASDSVTTETVNLAVPPGAAPGTYHATLTATVSGETRTGTMSYTVTAPPAAVTAAPPVSVTPSVSAALPQPPAPPKLVQRVTYLEHPTSRRLLAHGLHLHIGCNQSCSAAVDLVVVERALARGGLHSATVPASATVIGRTIVNLPQAGTRNVTVKLFAIPRAVLRHLGDFTLTVRTTVTNRLGAAGSRPTERSFAVARTRTRRR